MSPVMRVAVVLILCISEVTSTTSAIVKKMAAAPNPAGMRVNAFRVFMSFWTGGPFRIYRPNSSVHNIEVELRQPAIMAEASCADRQFGQPIHKPTSHAPSLPASKLPALGLPASRRSLPHNIEGAYPSVKNNDLTSSPGTTEVRTKEGEHDEEPGC